MTDNADTSKWLIVYPAYVDAKKSRAEGRRIGTEKACEAPTITEIATVCKALNIPAVPEPEKAYSRDYTARGRVRVQLKSDNGTPVNESVQSKHQLLLKLGELIPRLQTRAKPAAQSGKSKKKGKR